MLEESIIWRCLIHTLLGLECLHANNIIHRDVKSANVFIHIPGVSDLEGDGEIDLDDLSRAKFKLGDLNIAKLSAPGSMHTTMNGTPFFASPEMLNHRPYNAQQDVWSLGVTIYHLASLALPFQGDTIPEITKL